MSKCTLCPRECGADRCSGEIGFCGEGDKIRIARIAPHYFEEPCISGSRGSGTVFFTGCSLKCVFCQNKDISRSYSGAAEIDDGELYDSILSLQELGVHNINLVTPTHFLHRLIPLLKKLKTSGELKIPVLYNTSGYEKRDTLKRLDGLVDIYLPDLKYFSPALAQKYSNADDYPSYALDAICEMLRQRGKYIYSKAEPDILQSGVVVRHLILPSARKDSISLLYELAKKVNPSDILLSLMSQYTPDFALNSPYPELHRKITSFEYSSVLDVCRELGFDGFMQDISSSNKKYTPEFK